MTNSAPGMMPMVEYPYDYRRAYFTNEQLGDPANLFMWGQQGRIATAHVCYALAQFVDPRGDTATVEGGMLLFPMYDFCGGFIVSSAFTRVYLRLKMPGAVFRAPHLGAGEAANPWADPPPWSARNFPRLSQYIPQVGSYTGQSAHTEAEARAFMIRTLVGAVAHYSVATNRVAVVAADRRYGRTEPVMEGLQGRVTLFANMPGIRVWGDRASLARSPVHGATFCNFGPHAPDLYTTRFDFTPGEEFHNRNSGNMVSILTSRRSEAAPSPNRWKIPNEEMHKLTSFEYLSLAPQYLFHN